MTGGKFTWSNNHSDPTLERLDRVLVNKDWESIFPTVFVYKLPREVSDHNPLILSTQTSPPPKKIPFRFELTWLKDQNFTPVVKSIWDKPCHAHTALDRIQIKLKRFKQFFKGWGFNRQGEQKAKKKAMHEELLSLEQLEEDVLLSADQIRQKNPFNY